jgi:hypothetical protein
MFKPYRYCVSCVAFPFVSHTGRNRVSSLKIPNFSTGNTGLHFNVSSIGTRLPQDVTSHVNKDGGCKQSHVTRLMTFTGSDVTRWREI